MVPILVGAHSKSIRRLAIGLCVLVCAVAASVSSGANPTIVIDALTTRGLISPSNFGSNHRYIGHSAGAWDSAGKQLWPAFLDTFTTSGIGILRFPSGMIGNLYHWKRAIGPVANRTANARGTDYEYFGTDPDDFGPDEMGQMIEQAPTNSTFLVNWATGTADEAADWVEYMNAPNDGSNPRGGTDWAATRAANGHPAPYGIRIWEVGNEIGETEEYYWMRPLMGDSATIANLYIHGGSADWTNDGVVEYADFSNAAMKSDGTASQVKYARYPPVQPGEKLYVGGVLWLPVNDLATTTPTARAYVINRTTSEIDFGNATHGAIPANGAEIRLTYTSGPHDGFVDYYSKMKAADPGIQVYSSLVQASQFCQTMGESLPYDGSVFHNYPPDDTVADRTAAHNYWMVFPSFNIYDSYQAHPTAMANYAGARARDLKTIVTECSIPNLTIQNPGGELIEGNTLSEALYYALLLQDEAEMGIPVAMKHTLLSNTPGAAADVLFPYGTHQFGLSATAHAFGLLDRLENTHMLASWISGNPPGATSPQGSCPALQVLSTMDGADSLRILVTNVTLSSDVTASIRTVGYSSTGVAEIWQVDGAQIWSNNWTTHLNDVQTTCAVATVSSGTFSYRFPAHSLTLIKLARQQIGDARATVRGYSFTSPSNTVPGWYPANGEWYLTGTGKVEVTSQSVPGANAGYALHLKGGGANHGRATLSLPSDVTAGVLWISADVWAMDRSNVLKFTATDTNDNALAGLSLSRSHDGLIDYVKADGSWVNLTIPYCKAAWTNLDMILDVDHGMYDVWLDDKKVFIGPAQECCATSTPLRKINVESGATSGDTGEFYVDNVVVRQFINSVPARGASVGGWPLY